MQGLESETAEQFGNELVGIFEAKEIERLMDHIPADVVLTDGSDRELIRTKMIELFDRFPTIDGEIVEITKSDSSHHKIEILLGLTDAGDNRVGLTTYFFVRSQQGEFAISDICDDWDLKLKTSLGVLKSYSDFGDELIEDFPGFSYMPESDTHLVELRTVYQLDDVAGTGDEISRIIELMRWVHNTVRYDGSSTNPSPRHSLNIIEGCKRESRGVNCRMEATVLNEVYLSMGLKSRFVTCLPVEEQVDECHVVTEVFSESLDKWVCMDPSYEAYFTDDRGTLLGLAEIRSRLIAGDPIQVNDGININGRPYGGGAHRYTQYMAKNLVRFECLLRSSFCSESSDERAYVRLNPKQHSLAKRPTRDGSGIQVIFNTSNPDLFWARPM